MSTFVIADLHLSLGEECNKPMDVFGRRWTGYVEKLESRWRDLVTDADDVILPGDISWALTLSDARTDLAFIDSLPGRKYIGKGNHDFWWSSMAKLRAAKEEWQLSTLSFLYNNAIETEDFILAGTRGWFLEE
ncbi:MAG: metallophosphoesterase, partial [Clostridia bacterium]|nr:metallophosphoesterase [Clostridia bacterium]